MSKTQAEIQQVVDWLNGRDAWFLNDYVNDLVSKET